MFAARAILFDLDGTLVDSLPDIAAALTGAMVDHGLAAPAHDDVRDWIGGGVRVLIERALASYTAPHALVDDIHAGFRARYAAAPATHTRVFPGVDAALDRIAATGATLAIVTNKPEELAVRIADAVLGRWRFAVVAGQRPGVALKPDPAPALRVAAELGVSPEACAFVGDSDTDVATANAARMFAVGVSWGYRPRAELAGARVICDAPDELAALFAGA